MLVEEFIVLGCNVWVKELKICRTEQHVSHVDFTDYFPFHFHFKMYVIYDETKYHLVTSPLILSLAAELLSGCRCKRKGQAQEGKSRDL